jgi:glycosyltransferase involved in cell wall biosynthesis
MAPMFSVIICTHNRGHILPRAVQAILDQTFDDFELLIVDDGSTDDTRASVAEFADPRILYFYQENAGAPAARNAGVAAARGEFVTFLDDDDRVLPHWLERFARVIDREGCTVVCCGMELLDPTGRVLYSALPGNMGPAFDNLPGFFRSGTFSLTREAYLAVGGFAEIPASENMEFALRLLPMCRARGWRVGTVDEHLMLMSDRRPEERGQNSPVRILEACEYILSRYQDQLARAPRSLANTYAMAGVAAARLGSYSKARGLFRSAVQASEDPLLRRRNWLRLCVAHVPPIGAIVWRSRAYTAA